jgi:hypothetical protein
MAETAKPIPAGIKGEKGIDSHKGEKERSKDVRGSNIIAAKGI